MRPRAPVGADSRPKAESDTGLLGLLEDAVARLADATGTACAGAWVRLGSGEVVVTAPARGAASPDPPEPRDLAALPDAWRRPGAFDLGDPELGPGWRELATRHGVGAAAPLVSNEGTPLALLWVGGAEDPPGRVREGTLAALDDVVSQLRGPAAITGALRRLARLDEEVQRLDRLAALGDLLAEVVHELRNPLVSIKTFVQLLPESGDDPEFHTSFRSIVGDEIQRMERLLDSIVQQARPSAAEPGSSTSVPETLTSTADLVRLRAMEREVVLETEMHAALPPVAMPEDALRQVLINLGLNAVAATRSGGTVTLRAQPLGADAVEICVDDDGEGVASEWRDAVFEPFFSTRADRAGGLGLAITQRLVQEARGKIEVSDAPGGGARFRVVLPRA